MWTGWDGEVMSGNLGGVGGEIANRESRAGGVEGGERNIRVVGRGRVLDKRTEYTLSAFTCLFDSIAESDHV